MVTPSWLNSIPKNFGNAKTGSIKADEWQILSMVFLHIALVTLWGDVNGSAPSKDDSDSGLLLKALNHSMSLFQATILVCQHSMTAARTSKYWEYVSMWIDGL
ncbi:hypothetical protein GYMLUDRAFT_63757 [Collybiopsis luxurians FD-317 M1]|uniref:Uncharacterized protein n=1 Tax=Collybiopsis luxurians FD-317 M1 TaxID=944289 RepID=A0A0D0ASJ1_9AGAR|nr:hypothetical protein GYMLUDRAFT_63757 [Collybiopsis luxurians FD-317 M1]